MAKNAIATRKKPKALRPIKYTDGKSNWEALPGQPNGTFTVPGSDTLYSLSSLYEMIAKHCRPARMLTGEDIECLGEPTIEDAVNVTEGKTPRKSAAPVKTGKAFEKRSMVESFFKKRDNAPATKKQIAEGTGLTVPAVSALVVTMDGLKVTGKEGNTNLYALKDA